MRLIDNKTNRTVCVEKHSAVNKMLESGDYRLADKTDRAMKPGRAKNYKTK